MSYEDDHGPWIGWKWEEEARCGVGLKVAKRATPIAAERHARFLNEWSYPLEAGGLPQVPYLHVCGGIEAPPEGGPWREVPPHKRYSLKESYVGIHPLFSVDDFREERAWKNPSGLEALIIARNGMALGPPPRLVTPPIARPVPPGFERIEVNFPRWMAFEWHFFGGCAVALKARRTVTPPIADAYASLLASWRRASTTATVKTIAAARKVGEPLLPVEERCLSAGPPPTVEGWREVPQSEPDEVSCRLFRPAGDSGQCKDLLRPLVSWKSEDGKSFAQVLFYLGTPVKLDEHHLRIFTNFGDQPPVLDHLDGFAYRSFLHEDSQHRLHGWRTDVSTSCIFYLETPVTSLGRSSLRERGMSYDENGRLVEVGEPPQGEPRYSLVESILETWLSKMATSRSDEAR